VRQKGRKAGRRKGAKEEGAKAERREGGKAGRSDTLRYAEVFETRDDAFRRERQIKGWTRVKKEALARQDWQALQRLARTAHPSTGSG